MGCVPMHNVVPRLSGTPGKLRFAAPALGQHTREDPGPAIGYDAARIDALAANGVIKDA